MAGIDTRLQNGLLLDPKLQRRLTADEFKSFVNLLVFSVSLESDGVFDPGDTEMVMEPAHLEPMLKHGLIESCSDGELCRIAPEYQQWQTSKAQLDGLRKKRDNDAARKREARQKPQPDDFEAEAPFT